MHRQGNGVPYGRRTSFRCKPVENRAAPSQAVPHMTTTEVEWARPLHERRNALSDPPKIKAAGLN